jgi:carboxylesterase type B
VGARLFGAPGADGGIASSQLLARNLGISDGPDALAKLRAKNPEEILRATEEDQALNFYAGGAIDGWILREQPAITFAEGRQAKVPVIVGSNAMLGHTIKYCLACHSLALGQARQLQPTRPQMLAPLL